MSTVPTPQAISVEEYLAGELLSEVKHEYIAGVVHAMAGGSNSHNMIASNVQGELRDRLKDSPCREFNSDTKVRIQTQRGTIFYYPDVQVVCRPNPQTDTFQDAPVIIVEVLTDSTRRVDTIEKKDLYCSIPSLTTYIMIEQDTPQAIVLTRTETGFQQQVYAGLDATINIAHPAIQLSLKEVYRDIEFPGGN